MRIELRSSFLSILEIFKYLVSDKLNMKEVPKFKSFKERVNFYFEDVETFPGILTDLMVILLVLISSVVYIILSYPISDLLRGVLELVDNVIIVIFTFEYLLRFWVAEKKVKHFFNIYSLIKFYC